MKNENKSPIIRRMEDWSMILSFMVSAFVLINVSILIGRVVEERQYLNFYPYSYSAEVFFGESAKEDAFLGLINYLGEISYGNVSFTMTGSINGRINSESFCILTGVREELPFLKDGFKTAEKNSVYIGENINKYKFTMDGREYINIAGIDMMVEGVLKNHMSAGEDTCIYLLWDNCDDTAKQKLISRIKDSVRINVFLQSQNDLSEIWQETLDYMEQAGFEIDINPSDYRYEDNSLNDWYRLQNILIQGVCLAFSVFSCFTASVFWAGSLKKEIAIRRAFGWDMKGIAVGIFKDMCRLSCLSFLMALVLEVVYLAASGGFPSGWFLKLTGVFLMQLIVAIMVLSHILGKIKRFSMVELLREE